MLELHKWLSTVLDIPVAYGVTKNSITTGLTNPDYRWWDQHTSFKYP